MMLGHDHLRLRIRKLSTPNPAMDHTTSREGVGSHQNEEPACMAGSDQLAGSMART
jgi:hypothetical protein